MNVQKLKLALRDKVYRREIVGNFLDTYYRRERISDEHGGCKNFRDVLIDSGVEDLEKYGYTIISRYDSVMGKGTYLHDGGEIVINSKFSTKN